MKLVLDLALQLEHVNVRRVQSKQVKKKRVRRSNAFVRVPMSPDHRLSNLAYSSRSRHRAAVAVANAPKGSPWLGQKASAHALDRPPW